MGQYLGVFHMTTLPVESVLDCGATVDMTGSTVDLIGSPQFHDTLGPLVDPIVTGGCGTSLVHDPVHDLINLIGHCPDPIAHIDVLPHCGTDI